MGQNRPSPICKLELFFPLFCKSLQGEKGKSQGVGGSTSTDKSRVGLSTAHETRLQTFLLLSGKKSQIIVVFALHDLVRPTRANGGEGLLVFMRGKDIGTSAPYVEKKLCRELSSHIAERKARKG